MCGGKDRFRFDNRRGRGDYFCNQCGAGDGLTLVMRSTGLTFSDAIAHIVHLAGISSSNNEPLRIRANTPPQADQYERRPFSAFAATLWASTSGLSGVAIDYLQARALVVPPTDSDLRWHPALKHPEGFTGPALVALVRDAVTGEPMTLHRTWVASDGSKCGNPPRLLLKDHAKAGGVVMLWPSEAVTRGLGVAEGIESALALAHAFTPVWSCIDAGNLERLPILPGVESLSIAADGDEVGEHAAVACASRWVAAGREVAIVRPRRGTDLADVARAA
jgi:phage/plasmid primase-like uncharacterized protein